MNYDLSAVLKRMEESNIFDKPREMSLHGGEILTLPKKDVETLLAKSFELQGMSRIQTNGTLIDDDHIAMFKKYNTSVGISWDGPDELSEYRPGTKKVGAMIDGLIAQGIFVSIIIVISKANAGSKKRLDKLKKYLLHLKEINVRGRLNPLMSAKDQELPIERMVEVYLNLANFFLENNFLWPPFEEIIHSLQGRNRICFFSRCDSFSTPYARVVLGDGTLTNCMCTNKQDILLRDSNTYSTRFEILSKTPQEFGGCQGCPYLAGCTGGCPTGSIDNDWRNRSYLCPLWKALFSHYGKLLKYMEEPTAIGSDCHNSDDVVARNLDGQHGDHSDSGFKLDAPTTNRPHGDSPHGDSSHGDSSHGDSPHGDHSDLPAAK